MTIALLIDLKSYILPAVEGLKLAAELISVLIITAGIVVSVYKLLRPLRWPDVRVYNEVRLGFSRYLIMALEFELAADILGTSLTPTWDQLGRLAVVAVIRTFLNFFLQYEIIQEERKASEKR